MFTIYIRNDGRNFADVFSTVDYGIIDNINGFEKLEKVRDFILKNNLDKILIYHITVHIKTMIENLSFTR